MEQLITHITTLLRYGAHYDDPTGQLLQANGEAMQMEAGLNRQLFQLPQAMLPCFTDTWLLQCWQQCHLLQVLVVTDIKDFNIP